MAATDFSVGLNIGNTAVDDAAIIYAAYGVMWDRGSRFDALIADPDAAIHRALSQINGTPTPEITFTLAYLSSQNQTYKNLGSKRKMYLLKIGQIITPEGLCLRLRAVDRAYLALRSETTSFHAVNVCASDFLLTYLDQTVKLGAVISQTGDRPGTHRIMHGQPLGQMRYELDRVLSAGGKPLSMQFDDRDGKQQLFVYEEGQQTDPIASATSGVYVHGVGQPGNGATKGAAWGNTIHHFEMDQTYESVLWGHKVSVNHQTWDDAVVTGSKVSQLPAQLGVKTKLTDSVHRRIHMPRVTAGSENEDSYFAQALMTNATFHAEMSATSGYALIDPDFKAYDDVAILNRKHVVMSITGSRNQATGHAIVPTEAVVMGYQHVVNRLTSKTKLFLRRGK